ncbi:Asp23/Gls24 family envelope stress response protein [Actinomadura sp. 9N407]|uniref:Asp23/Gls24 family envelope stress response protein n=1 Tax=Actinomadura sp. 9N407 TaxID=3375154 RepID=UPI0037B4575A
MTDLDKGFPGNGAEAPRPEGRSMPFFPSPPSSGPPSTGGVPLAAPPHPAARPAPPAAPAVPAPALPADPIRADTVPAETVPADTVPAGTVPAGPIPADPVQTHTTHTIPAATPAAVVKGRITIEDQVIEKIAVLAALEVAGVAGSAACTARSEPAETAGTRAPVPVPGLDAPKPGVRVHLHDNEVTLDLSVAVEYGCVIMDVAKQVKTNVARVVSRMLGMRVIAVNVAVDDVRAPSPAG